MAPHPEEMKMKKIPTLFLRDIGGYPQLVTRDVDPRCEWVIDGDGKATRKFNGMCAMFRDGKLYKRLQVKSGKLAPADFELLQTDEKTGKAVGWVPVGDSAGDQYFREAAASARARDGLVPDGTYELVGPKVQNNSEGYFAHRLLPHGEERCAAPRTFDALKVWLSYENIEGVVWHHPDGRKAKIKKQDFGLPRVPAGA